MESRAHAVIAGLFTVALGIAVIVAAMWLSREDFDRVVYVLQSPYSVSGLSPQAPVRLRGVAIGKVLSIEFDEEDPKLILITVLVKAGSRITRGTTAVLNAQGITGTSYVMLEDDGSNPTFRPPSTDKADRIAVQRSLLDAVANSGQEILYDVQQMTKQLHMLFSQPNQEKLVATLSSVQEATTRLSTLAKALEPGARELTAATGDARKALASADTAIKAATPALKDAGPALQEARAALASIDKLAQEYAKRSDALDRVAKSAEQFGGATQGAANAVTEDISPRLNALLEELSRTSRNLDKLLAELNQQPSGLVFGRPSGRPGPGENGYKAGPGAQP